MSKGSDRLEQRLHELVSISIPGRGLAVLAKELGLDRVLEGIFGSGSHRIDHKHQLLLELWKSDVEGWLMGVFEGWQGLESVWMERPQSERPGAMDALAILDLLAPLVTRLPGSRHRVLLQNVAINAMRPALLESGELARLIPLFDQRSDGRAAITPDDLEVLARVAPRSADGGYRPADHHDETGPVPWGATPEAASLGRLREADLLWSEHDRHSLRWSMGSAQLYLTHRGQLMLQLTKSTSSEE